MPKNKTPTFIHELRLNTTPSELKILNRRLDVARQLYNACLGGSLTRLRLLKESKLYQAALKLPKQIKNKKGKLIDNKERKRYFKEAKDNCGFSEYALHAYLTTIYSKTWLSTHVDSLTSQKIATRAFQAVEAYAYGRKGRPRFKGKNQFSSIEGKNNQSGLRFVDGEIIWSSGRTKLVLKPRYDLQDKEGLEAYALSCRTKYVRLVQRKIKGNRVWYAQLVQEGLSYMKEKHTPQTGVVGLDVGPSTVAIVGQEQASLQAFCSELDDTRKEIAFIQRKLSRSLRLNNPNNFESNYIVENKNQKKLLKLGKIKKGSKKWHQSNQYQAWQVKLSELQRKMAATRKAAHGRLVNQVISMGATIKTEKLSYQSFQKNFGKSVGFRAPGLFLEILRRKAERAGGEVVEFNTRTTALSQTCHCGHKKKKLLKERWHRCDACGIVSQRDLYSAFLARFVENNRLDAFQAGSAWASAGILLEQAVSSLNETTISKVRLASFGLGQSQSRLPVKKGTMQDKALDVVA